MQLDRKGDGQLEDTYFTFVYAPLRGKTNAIEGILVFAYEVTEQVIARRKRDEFIGIASHELKTPVTSIKAYTQLLERRFRRAGDEPAAELLSKMDSQLNKLTFLIGDLLDITKIEGGKLQLHYSSFDLNVLIKEIVDEAQRTTTRHRIIQELSPPVTLLQIEIASARC